MNEPKERQKARPGVPVYAVAFPLACYGLIALIHFLPSFRAGLPPPLETAQVVVALGVLIGAVFAALYHAEIVGEYVGQPYGTVILTICVTLIEVTIITAMMLHGDRNPTLARESVFSVVIIVCAGLVGVCLFIGAIRHRVQDHQTQATSSYLAVLMALSVLTLILPDYTSSTKEQTYSPHQLAFVSVASVLLYATFLFTQTVRHTADFLEIGPESGQQHSHHKPARGAFIASLCALPICLVGVVFLAEHVARHLEDLVAATGVPRPDAINGAIIAILVLMPEAVSAIRAAARNALQTSLNVALGSALATIGLTIPAVAMVALATGQELVLGLEPRDYTLLLLTLGISVVSFGTGRTNMLSGAVHLVIFASYLVFLVAP